MLGEGCRLEVIYMDIFMFLINILIWGDKKQTTMDHRKYNDTNLLFHKVSFVLTCFELTSNPF